MRIHLSRRTLLLGLGGAACFATRADAAIRVGYAAITCRVDVKGCVAALRDIGFNGWTIIELDRVPDANGSPKESAKINRSYTERELGLSL